MKAMKKPPHDPAEFDGFANNYEELIRDPIRERFAGESSYFATRKIEVMRRFFDRRGIDTRKLDWLDVGCGKGDLLRLGSAFFKSATGCDPSAGMLETSAGLNVKHQPDMLQLPFADASFDLVTAVCVYHHVPPDQRAALTDELRRVTRRDGPIAIIEHNPYNPATRLIVSRTPVDANAQLLTPGSTSRMLTHTEILATQFFLLLPERLRALLPIENALAAWPLGGQYAVFARKS
jgi:SAM-dependent methyltransferase